MENYLKGIVIILLSGFVQASSNPFANITYVFPDNTCGLPVSTRHTNASQLFIFKYEGREIPEDCQTVGLHSSDASLNHYVLCVTAASFIDPNCSVTVQFTFSNNVMEFNCNTTENETFCTNQESELKVKTMTDVGYQNAKFTIFIQNELSTIHSDSLVTDMGVVAGIAIGCTLGVLIIALVCYMYIRGRNSSRAAYHSAKS